MSMEFLWEVLTKIFIVLKFIQRAIVVKRVYKMSKKHSLYNEIKATQVACLLLKLNGGEMDYAKCIKLLYSIEREALNRWMRPVIYDDLYSLPYGQVVSQTLDKAEYWGQATKSFWGEYLENYDGKNIRLIKECGRGKLSRAEIDLIEEIFRANKDKTAEQLFGEHHNPALFPEYQDPYGSSIKTTYAKLLRTLGKTKEQIKEFEEDMNELAYLEEMTR